jgi:hypothetical protein
MINRNNKSNLMVHKLFYFLLLGFLMLLSTETLAQGLGDTLIYPV